MKHAPLSRLRRVLCFILALLMLPFAAFPARYMDVTPFKKATADRPKEGRSAVFS